MTNRKLLEAYGRKRRRDYVRVFRETVNARAVVRVQWKEGDRTRTETFEDTRKGIAEAKGYAEGVHERLLSPAKVEIPTITVRDLFEKYVTAKMDAWRPRTLEVAKQRWGAFELFARNGAEPAELITRETLDSFKRQMVTLDHSVNQVRMHLQLVTAVFRWAVDRDLVAPTKIVNYRPEFGRDAKRQVATMSEYRADERARVLAQLDPRKATTWRAYVLTVLFAYCGPRQRAARHLEWRDIDLTARRIHWRPELDKMGEDRWQPMPEPVLEAMWVAYGWRCHDEYPGPFVFYGVQRRTRGHALRRDPHRAKGKESLEGIIVQEKPWTYQSYHAALTEAEARAEVEHVPFRAAHGFRRGIAGDVHSMTGSSKTAASWIGDKSTKIVERHYLLEREDELRVLAGKLSGNKEGE